MRVLLRKGALSADLISWLGRNLQLTAEKNICRPEVFAQTALSLLQKALAAGKRKDVGQLLREIFTDKDLLKEIFQPMDDNQRLDFSRRLNSLAGLPESDKIEIAARIIPLFPGLTAAFSAPPVVIARPKLTSYRSYRARQSQLEKIINEEIPRNSKEIGVARSYGDLKENHEYKAAREMQGLLMRRKVELEQMLSEVRESDFTGFPHEVAGQGTSVELKTPDGKKEIYHILGELDSDEKLGIISCRSKLAEALNGHCVGERVEIPGENAAIICALEAIRELPPEIKAWINGP
jgi:transcription elongation GreA/GreB family factor